MFPSCSVPFRSQAVPTRCLHTLTHTVCILPQLSAQSKVIHPRVVHVATHFTHKEGTQTSCSVRSLSSIGLKWNHDSAFFGTTHVSYTAACWSLCVIFLRPNVISLSYKRQWCGREHLISWADVRPERAAQQEWQDKKSQWHCTRNSGVLTSWWGSECSRSCGLSQIRLPPDWRPLTGTRQLIPVIGTPWFTSPPHVSDRRHSPNSRRAAGAQRHLAHTAYTKINLGCSGARAKTDLLSLDDIGKTAKEVKRKTHPIGLLGRETGPSKGS